MSTSLSFIGSALRAMPTYQDVPPLIAALGDNYFAALYVAGPGVEAQLFRVQEDDVLIAVGPPVGGPVYVRDVADPDGSGEVLVEILSVSDLSASKAVVLLNVDHFTPGAPFESPCLDVVALERVGGDLLWGSPRRAYTEFLNGPSPDVDDPIQDHRRYWFGHAYAEALAANKGCVVAHMHNDLHGDRTSSIAVRGFSVSGRSITMGPPFTLLKKEPIGTDQNFQMSPVGRRVAADRLLVYIAPWSFRDHKLHLVQVDENLSAQLLSTTMVPGPDYQSELVHLTPLGGDQFALDSQNFFSGSRAAWRVDVTGTAVSVAGPQPTPYLGAAAPRGARFFGPILAADSSRHLMHGDDSLVVLEYGAEGTIEVGELVPTGGAVNPDNLLVVHGGGMSGGFTSDNPYQPPWWINPGIFPVENCFIEWEYFDTVDGDVRLHLHFLEDGVNYPLHLDTDIDAPGLGYRTTVLNPSADYAPGRSGAKWQLDVPDWAYAIWVRLETLTGSPGELTLNFVMYGRPTAANVNVEVVGDTTAVIGYSTGVSSFYQDTYWVRALRLESAEEDLEALPEPGPFWPLGDLSGRRGPGLVHYVRSPR